MPIRFRCAYCNQLMGIARRKAGSVVRCPTCAGQVVVPSPDAPEPPQESGKADLFEHSDIDEVLQKAAPASAGREFPSAPRQASRADVELAPVTLKDLKGSAVSLTAGKIIILILLVLVLVGIAFFAGYTVGKG